MTCSRFLLIGFVVLGNVVSLRGDEKADLSQLLGREIIGSQRSLAEAQDYCETRVPRLPKLKSAAEWQTLAERLRTETLARAVYRGEAAAWRDAQTKVEWLDTIPGGPGYHIKKLRYEALPGLWIPALLYVPDKLSGKVPVSLNVNGHDRDGKAAKYKQIRCINQAKRGMIALNPEWLAMGQLRGENYAHGRMNQLDLCGTSGLAPFYLAMKRGLDVLLSLENADPERVAVSGLSGGGWQTIIISSLDPRVKLANPVAGYSSFLTRIRFFSDLGDSEQTPCDLGTVADYHHLTAMRAPRPTLLTYNAEDDCCFRADHALPTLMKVSTPVFQLFGKENHLRGHVNFVPGTHNFEKDNREAFYRMLGDFFFAGNASFDAKEIPSDTEVKTKDELAVPLPTPNADFHSLAMEIAKKLPAVEFLSKPSSKEGIEAWQTKNRQLLKDVVKAKDYAVKAAKVGSQSAGDVRATFWRLTLGDAWSVPVVELVKGTPKSTAILVNDAGRKADPVNAGRLLNAGQRVLAVDPFYFGEAQLASHGYLFALLMAALGERPLGIHASQLAAVARWSQQEFQRDPIHLVAVGPRLSTVALVAAALEEKAIGRVELHGALGSLKEVLEQNRSVEQMPEMFCFGLLKHFDLNRMVALCLPRSVEAYTSSGRPHSFR